MRTATILTRLLALLALLAVAASTPSAGAQDTRLPPGVAARVYGRDIPEADVLERLARNYAKSQRGAELLGQMIDDTGVAIEAQRRGVTVTAAELEEYVARWDETIKKQSRGQDSIASLYEDGSREEFLVTAREFLLRQKMARTDLGRRADEELSEKYVKLWIRSLRTRLGVSRVDLSPTANEVLENIPIGDLPPGVLARVGERDIDRQAFARHLRDKLPEEMVSGVLMELVVAAAAEHRLSAAGEAVAPEEVEVAIDRMRERFLEDPQVKDTGITFGQFLLRTRGLTVDDLRSDPTFRSRIGLRRLLDKDVSDDEVRERWSQNREAYGERSLVRQVFFAAKDGGSGDFKLPTFKEAWKEALGAKVDVLAAAGLDRPGAERSRVPVTQALTQVAKRLARNDEKRRAAGEPVVWSRLTVNEEPTLGQAVFEGPVGELQGPIRSSVGYHVLVVEDRRPAPPFDDIRLRVREDVVQDRLNRFGIDVRNDSANVILGTSR